MGRMIRVGINGYHTIGARVADAVKKQSDMQLVGVSKVKPDYRARIAGEKGIDIYAANEKSLESFRNSKMTVKGTIGDLLKKVDVIVDATPDEVGASNKLIYERAGVKGIFQGGEEHSLTNLSFVAQCNYGQAVNKQFVRVVSCNTTALCRTLHALERGSGIERARAVLVRRGADPDEVSKGPIDAVVLDPPTVPSHHAPDVQSVMKGLNIVTMAVKVPETHMHLHSLLVTLKRKESREVVVDALESEPRLALVDAKTGVKSTAALIDMAREMGRPRNDIYEAVVWRDSISVSDNEVYLFLAVHQEAIVIPENIDAIRAVSGGYTQEQSMKATDDSLGITTGTWTT
ncbi:MAG TPA: type II glyceraldehyde-3-phosphate dehydrogenase [Nitrososphaerales archaeon]|nr:type II glyceraldehyde-3-phosphate dehydrogenase [Nitrososphaerales archaeon]